MDQGKAYIDKDGLAWIWADDGINEPDWTQQVVFHKPGTIHTGPMGMVPGEIESKFGPMREAGPGDSLLLQYVSLLDPLTGEETSL